MKLALIFLNGYYDLRHLEFYKQQLTWGLANNYPLICADGGIRLFHSLNQIYNDTQFLPNVLIGDLDSFEETSTREGIKRLEASGTHIVREWVGRVDKDYTDGQLAIAYAIEECECQRIIIYGGLPRPHEYETDHFLGNLKLMRFGFRLFSDRCVSVETRHHPLVYEAEMRDVFQTIHFVVSELRLERKNDGLQRVSLIADHANVLVERSENLRWDVSGLRIDPDMAPDLPSTLRNEFATKADWATISLAKASDPVYVIHNWYEM